MNYYCLIAGLPDIQADDTKALTPLADLKKELSEQLSDMDRDLLNLLFAAYDNRNLLTWLSDKEAALHPASREPFSAPSKPLRRQLRAERILKRLPGDTVVGEFFSLDSFLSPSSNDPPARSEKDL